MDARVTLKLRCTECGAETDAACGCGAPYEPLSLTERNKLRKAKATDLYKDGQGLTMEEIAEKLKVGFSTVQRDLGDLPKMGKSKRPKTATNPKGSGRTKGSTRRPERKHKNEPPKAKQAAELFLDKGKSRDQVKAETGMGLHEIQLAVERERGGREMLALLLDAAAAKNFSEKGALRIDDAIRIHKARLDKQFEQVVNEEVRKRIAAADDAARADNKRLREENTSLQRIINQKRSMTVEDYMLVLSCVHPDSRDSVTTEKLQRAFQVLRPRKYAITGEK